MKRVGADIERLVASLSADSDQARINLRARQVRERYRKAIESVYRDTSDLFLRHTNNVYIIKKGDEKKLIVYVDESIFAAELNAQRELIKLKLLELFGEQIDQFDIHVSKGAYKKYHPYYEDEDEAVGAALLEELPQQEREYVSATASSLDDSRLRRSFEEAMTATLARNRAENGER